MSIFNPNGVTPRVVTSSTWSGDPQRNPPQIQRADSLNMESRRAEVERTVETFVKVNRLSGWIKISGTGELTQDVVFPMFYIERPSFSCGFELDEASPLETGNFPTYSVTVSSWQKATAGEIGEYWIGATLAIVLNGNADQIGIVHWQMEGKAMVDIGQANQDNGGGIEGA